MVHATRGGHNISQATLNHIVVNSCPPMSVIFTMTPIRAAFPGFYLFTTTYGCCFERIDEEALERTSESLTRLRQPSESVERQSNLSFVHKLFFMNILSVICSGIDGLWHRICFSEGKRVKSKLLFISSLAAALSAMTAGAIPISDVLNQTQYQSASGTNGNSVAGNLNLLNSIINPDETSVGASYDGLNLTSLPFVSGWHYAVVHFGNVGSAGSPGGYWQVYDLSGNGGTLDTSSVRNLAGQTVSVGAISSVRYVPDGGSTLMLLGAAFSVIGVARRKFGV